MQDEPGLCSILLQEHLIFTAEQMKCGITIYALGYYLKNFLIGTKWRVEREIAGTEL
jgi:hypothetical protein